MNYSAGQIVEFNLRPFDREDKRGWHRAEVVERVHGRSTPWYRIRSDTPLLELGWNVTTGTGPNNDEVIVEQGTLRAVAAP